MADKKRKSKNLIPVHAAKKTKTKRDERTKKKKTGPRLPSSLRKELDIVNPTTSTYSDEEIDSDEGNDIYEYEEGVPEEEVRKNKRFDPVENFEYELPDDFKDEHVFSDDDIVGSEDYEDAVSDGDEAEEEDDGRHARMLQAITGMPPEAFDGKKNKNDFVISEAYPEFEYNPSRDVLDGDGNISIQDLLDSLHGKAGYSKLKKRTHELEKKSTSVHAPLPKADRERLERKVAYEHSKKDITKWEPLVKKNREAPTIYFDEDTDMRFSTVGEIASEFEPRTDFERKMAALVHDERVVEAHKTDGSRLLQLNKISIEEVKERQNRLAKMRSLLFRHEIKAKHKKNIKSKKYHRLLKKDRLKAVSAEMQMDPEAAKELAMKQEFKRAEERMTLKHKNSSKWAKRILKRGLSAQDEGTRVAISEQLHQHALLTRKMNSMKDNSSSSDDSSDEDDDGSSAGSDHDGPSKLLAKAKERTLKVLDEEDEMPNSGVLSLPFMVCGLKKKKEAAREEAKLALEEYESSLKQLDDTNEAIVSSGRRVFGAAKKQVQEFRTKREINYNSSDSEDDFKAKENFDIRHERSNDLQKDAEIDANILREESEIDHDSVFKSFNDIVKDSRPKTTYEVAIFASDLRKKKQRKNKVDVNTKSTSKVTTEHVLPNQDLEEVGEDSDTDSEGHMVDGILSSAAKPTYELPSQAELIRRAFAGDDVEDDFEKDKQEILNEENPEPEKPVLLPGWGQWTNIQRKKGLPSWMVKEHENEKRKREEALKYRKDAHLKNVIISEKLDKKAQKLHTKTLPFPYTSKEVFEQSIRMPIGPEYNPASTIGALNRPEVVKRAGVIIKPIQFEDVNPHEKSEEHKQGNHKQKNKNAKSKSGGGKNQKKMKKQVKT